MAASGLVLSLARASYRTLLRWHPAARAGYAPQMQATFDAMVTRAASKSHLAVLRVSGREVLGLLTSRRSPAWAAAVPQRRSPLMRNVSQDVVFALRTFRRRPGFTTAIVATIALGIGANTAILSVANAVLLQRLPFADPSRLVMVWEDASALGFPRNTPAPGNYFDWATSIPAFAGAAAMSRTSGFNLVGDGDPDVIDALQATGNLFTVLGVPAAVGRVWQPDEDVPGSRIAVIGHALWTRRFHADPAIVGQTVDLSGTPYTIVGVMPERFEIVDPAIQIWTPLGFTAAGRQNRGGHYLEVVARLAPGATLTMANSQLRALASRLQTEHPETNRNVGMFAVPLLDDYVGDTRTALLALLAAVGCVLLIACVNVANLLLTHAAGRAREMAVRTALGADRRRLVRQLLTESLLLALAGGGLGVVMASQSFAVLTLMVPPALANLSDVTLDLRVLAATGALSVATGLLFGLAPAWRASHVERGLTSTRSARGVIGAGTRLRSGLVIAEIALATAVLIAAGLLVQSFRAAQGVTLGFRPAGVLTLRTSLPRRAYQDPARRTAFVNAVLDGVRHLPGVVSAGVTSALPLTWKGGTAGFLVDGVPMNPSLPYDANNRTVSAGYMEALGFTLLAGRFFDDRDSAAGPPVAIINETMARQYLDADRPARPSDEVRRAGFALAHDRRHRRGYARHGHRAADARGDVLPDRPVRRELDVAARPGDPRHGRSARARSRRVAGRVDGRSDPADRRRAADGRHRRQGTAGSAPADDVDDRLRRTGALPRGDWHLRRAVPHGQRAHGRNWRATGARQPAGANSDVVRGTRPVAGRPWRRNRLDGRVLGHGTDRSAALRRARPRPAYVRDTSRRHRDRLRRGSVPAREAGQPDRSDRRAPFGVGSRAMRLVLLGAVLLLATAAPRATQDREDPEAHARAIVASLVAGDYAAIEAQYTETMSQALPPGALAQRWSTVKGQVGPYESISGVSVATAGVNRVVSATCVFEKYILTLRVTFDDHGRLAGLLFTSPTARSTWSPPDYADASAFENRQVTVRTGRFELPGIAAIPKSPGPHPAVVLVHGSGPNDMDETLGPNKMFADLAEGLASRGVAVLRYEKRSHKYGRQSSDDPARLTVNDEVTDDARSAVALMAALPEVDPRRIVIAGHSLGGYLAPRIAAGQSNIAGLILLAGSARPLEDLVVEQVRYEATLAGVMTPAIQKAIDDAEASAKAMRDPDLKPGMVVDVLGSRLPATYALDLRNYHPTEVAGALSVPMLVLQGERDYQVTMTDFGLWRRALGGRSDVTLKSYPALNHLFIAGIGPASPADYARAGHVDKGVVEDIAAWCARLPAHR